MCLKLGCSGILVKKSGCRFMLLANYFHFF